MQYYEYFDYRRHPLQRPPLEGGVEGKRHAVAICGAGPIGLALALGLARHGIAAVVIEADDTVTYGSRASCISRRSQEILDQLGCVDTILQKALPWTAGTSYYRDTPVYRLQMPMDENQKFYPMVNLEQCYFDQFVLDAIEKKYADLVDIRWQTKLTGFSRDAHGARLQLDTAEGPYQLDCDWLIACDGARSAVRSQMGLRFSGSRYEGTYIIVDVHLKSSYPTERRAWFNPPSNPASTILMHRQPDDIWRVDYQLRDGEDPIEAQKPENVLPRVRAHLEWIGERDDWEPVLISAYKANCLTLDQYNHGRVLFAGDAAHLVPIFGVRGMNSGIDDTHNLAWKLAYVIQGHAQASLLDTYSDERVHAARENIRHASKSTEFMAPPSHAFYLMREAALSLSTRDPFFSTLSNPRQTSAISYEQSRLTQACEAASGFGPPPGAVLPECPIERDGLPAHLTELPGTRFTLIALSDSAPDIAAHPLLAVHWVSPTRNARASAWDVTGRLFPMYGASAQAPAYYLVRPDGHVLARFAAVDSARIHAALQAALQ
ncbi:MAG TPA: FAD-dependent monooxygenase [Burkholderiales bacterium]|jgi:3-(3-hydroxy-phenyl)propionate hydroxylase